jgi:Sec-independent protein secretion pathway component TatC
MTNRILTALVIRIAGIFLLTKIFDHFGSYFLSIFLSANIARFDKMLIEPIDKFYFTGTFLTIVNVFVSVFLFVKAEWIAKKLIKTDNEIKTELNAKSLTKVLLLTVGVIWLAKLLYLIPNLIDYCYKFISRLNGNEEIGLPDFAFANYILKTILTLIIIFRIEKISNWIIKKI